MKSHSFAGVYSIPETATSDGSATLPLLEKLKSRRNAIKQLADQDQAILCHPAVNKLYSADRIRERRLKLLAEVRSLDEQIEKLKEGAATC